MKEKTAPTRGGPRPGAGGQRQDPAAARIVKSYRIHPATAQAIEQAARAQALSQGQILDRLASSLPAGSPTAPPYASPPD